MEDYQIPPGKVVAECEQEIRKKVKALRWWLYNVDDENEVRYRMAPSLIVRSEAELFGISSPRFAVRAYFSDYSFINIRRGNALRGMIDQVFEKQDICEKLQASFNTSRHVWIADSLLEPPPRLIQKGYEFITVDLGREYGEANSGNVVPFVTHISIGGGLCAQASCFMAMCMANSQPIFGISEITKLAASDPRCTKIHGLTAESITSFFVGKKKAERKDAEEDDDTNSESGDIDLSAQLQTFPTQEVNNKRREIYLAAMESYILNGIPLIYLVSSSRMQGVSFKGTGHDPIIRLNGYQKNHKDYSQIPIGLPPTEKVATAILASHDNHCVVICGTNGNGQFCINDPATFPFLEASIDQLLDAGKYVKEGEIGGSINLDEGPDKTTNRVVGPPQFIATTPNKVVAPLLNFTESVKNIIPEANQDPEFNFRGVLQTALDVRRDHAEINGVENLDLKFGQLFLIELSQDLPRLKSPRRDGFPALDSNLLSELKDGWYWVELIDHPFGPDKTAESLWFWHASDLDDREEVKLVLQKQNSDNSSWTRCADFD